MLFLPKVIPERPFNKKLYLKPNKRQNYILLKKKKIIMTDILILRKMLLTTSRGASEILTWIFQEPKRSSICQTWGQLLAMCLHGSCSTDVWLQAEFGIQARRWLRTN